MSKVSIFHNSLSLNTTDSGGHGGMSISAKGAGGDSVSDFFAKKLKRVVFTEWSDNSSGLYSSAKIPPYALYGHSEIEEVVFPTELPGESVDYFGYGYQFYDCINLKKIINFPNNANGLSSNMFSYCESLEEFDIPDSVERIYNNCFMNCKSLKSVKIPSKLISISDDAFSETKVEELDFSTVGDSEVMLYTFGNNMPNLKKVILPKNSKFSGNKMITFLNCSHMESINIPKGAKSIGNNWDTKSIFGTGVTLKDPIYLSKNLTSITKNAFLDCDGVLNCEWSEGAVANAPWGFLGTINYDIPYVDAY